MLEEQEANAKKNQKRDKMKSDVSKFMEKEGIVSEKVKRERFIREMLGEDAEDAVIVGENTSRQMCYRRNSFKRLLKNDSLKYFENGQ